MAKTRLLSLAVYRLVAADVGINRTETYILLASHPLSAAFILLNLDSRILSS